MRIPGPNWDLNRIPVSYPYIHVLVRGRPQHRDDDFSRRHPRMEQPRRAKIFAPFDALDGHSAEIAGRNSALVESMEKNGR